MSARDEIARRLHANSRPAWTENPDTVWAALGSAMRDAYLTEADRIIAIARREVVAVNDK